MASVIVRGSNYNAVKSDMENNPVVRRPCPKKVNRRYDVLAYLRSTIRENGDFIHFPNKLPLFKELYNILGDDQWEVRHECLQLINELIPISGSDLNPCMEVVLPRLIRNMGHPKVAIRRATIQTLHSYMKHTDNVQHVLQAIVSFGLDSEEQGPGQECTVLSLPMLLTPEFDKENYTILVQALARQLVIGEDDKQQAAFFSLQKIKQLVGDERFQKYLRKLDSRMVNEYGRLLESENNNIMMQSRNEALQAESQASENGGKSEALEFGVIPKPIFNKLMDQEDWKARCHGTELLKGIINNLADVSPLLPHISGFLMLLNRLVSDLNFKITTVSLDIYRILIDKIKYRIRPHLSTVVHSLSRHLADSKIIVRSGCIRALTQLMQCVSPMPVISILIVNLQHKSSRLREETINLIAAALLTFPSYEFDLLVLCDAVVPMLTDAKRKIRQSVLECLAVLSQSLGPARSSMVLEVVESHQRKQGLDHLVVAVQSRLARRILPRITSDGLIEYSVHIPNTVGRKSHGPTLMQGADVDWILAGSGTLSSGSGSARTESDRDTSSGTSRSSPIGSVPSSPGISRRLVSPGRNRARLPWENGSAENKEFGRRARAGSDDSIFTKFKDSRLYTDNDGGHHTSNGINQSNIDFTLSWSGSVKHISPGVSQKQVYLQKLRHQAERNGEKGPVSALGVSILPNKPKGVAEDEKASPSPPRGSKVSKHSHDHVATSSQNPIPTRATIVRSTSAHKLKKVPPIGGTPEKATLSDEKKRSFQTSELSASPSGQKEVLEDLELRFEGAIQEKSVKLEESFSPQPESEWSTVSCSSSEKNAEKEERSVDDDDEDDIPFNSKPVIMRSASLNRMKVNTNNNLIHHQPNTSSDTITRVDSFTDEDMNVIGRGMVLRNSACSSVKTLPRQPPDPHTPPGLEDSPKSYQVTAQIETLPRIQGVRMGNGTHNRPPVNSKQHEPDYFSSDYLHLDDAEDSDEEIQEMEMSRATRDRLLFKKQQLIREAEKHNRQQLRRPPDLHDLRFATEDDVDGQNYRYDENDNDELDEGYHPPVSVSKYSAAKIKSQLSNSLNKKLSKSPQTASLVSMRTTPSPRPALSSNRPANENDSRPFKNPDSALQDAIKHLNSAEWSDKCEGLQSVSRIGCNHPEVLLPELHNVNVLLLREVKNLRSSVSRAAIVCIGNLFMYMNKYMEPDLEAICKVLLHKSGDTNKFIQDDVEKSLMSMVDNINPQKAGLALLNGGANHKNANVRKLTSFMVSDVTHNLGAAKLLSGTKDITERFLVTASQFVMDNSPHTRYYGRLIFHQIIYHPQFETMLQKFLSPNVIRNIRSILDGIKTKGPGDKPSDSPSGRSRKPDLSKTM